MGLTSTRRVIYLDDPDIRPLARVCVKYTDGELRTLGGRTFVPADPPELIHAETVLGTKVFAERWVLKPLDLEGIST